MTIFIYFLALNLSISANSQRVIFPDQLWVVSNPEIQKVESRQLQKALNTLKKYCGEDGLEETVIVRNGYLIYHGDSVYKQHDIYSCSNVFTSTALGMFIYEGRCSLDDYASDFEPLLSNEYSGIKLRHLTTMTSGYSSEGRNPKCNGCTEDLSSTPYRPVKPLFAPGTAFCFWDESQMMFSRVLTQILKSDLKEYLDSRIMTPLGITRWEWSADTEINGIPVRNGSMGIKLNALQLARVGHLFLNKGRWKDEQLIPSEWIDEATSVQVDGSVPIADTDRKNIQGNGRYGYNWWIRGNSEDMPDMPRGIYYMKGANNNVCFVIPEWDMVVVRMGLDGDPAEGIHFVYNQFFKELGKSIVD